MTPRSRPTARLIVLDDADRLLLFQVEDDSVTDPDYPAGQVRPDIFWVTPGGGLEPGETYEAAARRELREETGFTTGIGPCVHEDEKTLLFAGEAIHLRQRYFVVRVPTSSISLDGFTPIERSSYRDHRWWTVAELEATLEAVFPYDLVAIIRRVLQMR